MGDRHRLLSGLKVVDLGQGMAPALVARFLADAGASVVRVPPEGDAAFAAVYPAYESWHGGARIADADELAEALGEADICITGGEDHPDVHRRQPPVTDNPRLVSLVISGDVPEGDGGDHPLNELLAQARSGIVYEHFPERPLAMGFAPANIGAALHGLIGLLAALIERETSGLGQIVRTSLVEGAQGWLPMFWAQFETPDAGAAFVSPKEALPLIFRCADGLYLHFVIGAAGSKYKLYRVLQIDDPTVLPGDNGSPRIDADPRNFYGEIDLLAEHVARWKRDDLLEALWAEGLPAEPVLPPGALWDDPQIVRNGIIATGADGTRSIGSPFMARIVPTIGARPLRGGAKPLDGIRVIDFGAYVAGPLASQMLTGLGADVIKVEPPQGDPSRGMVRGYLSANRGKRGITLDLKADRATAVALATGAHVVTSNFRGGVAERLGIDAATLSRLQPDLIVLESPAYGMEGPSRDRAGFDMVMQAVSGLEHRAGGGQGEPLWNRLSMVDFAGGMLGAVAILCALYHRKRAGEGVQIEVPLINAGLFLLSELVQRPGGAFVGAPPIIGEGRGFSPTQAMYETRNGWVMVSAQGKDAETGLRRALRMDDGQPLDFGTIAAAAATAEAHELVDRLRDHDVWAEHCRTDAEAALLNDPASIERGAVRLTTHRRFGRTRDIGPLFRLSRSPLGSDRPIHEIGEHNSEILNNIRDY